jgi:hypothetical protein
MNKNTYFYQSVYKWDPSNPLSAATARLVESLSSPYHFNAAMPHRCMPLIGNILQGQASITYLASQSKEYRLHCPIVFDFLFHLARRTGSVPERISPLLHWICQLDELMFPKGSLVSMHDHEWLLCAF